MNFSINANKNNAFCLDINIFWLTCQQNSVNRLDNTSNKCISNWIFLAIHCEKKNKHTSSNFFPSLAKLFSIFEVRSILCQECSTLFSVFKQFLEAIRINDLMFFGSFFYMFLLLYCWININTVIMCDLVYFLLLSNSIFKILKPKHPIDLFYFCIISLNLYNLCWNFHFIVYDYRLVRWVCSQSEWRCSMCPCRLTWPCKNIKSILEREK